MVQEKMRKPNLICARVTCSLPMLQTAERYATDCGKFESHDRFFEARPPR
jgi:hypothetical protein